MHETAAPLDIPEAVLAPRPPAAVLDERDGLVAKATALEVRTPDEYRAAGELLRTIKGMRKGIAAFFEPVRTQLRAAVNALSDREKESDAPLARAEEITKGKMGGFEQEDRARKAAELKKAALAAAADPEQGLEQLMAAAAAATKKTKAEGISTRTLWSASVVDFEKLARWAMEDWANRGRFLLPNDRELSSEARKLKDQLAIPGVDALSETSIASRS